MTRAHAAVVEGEDVVEVAADVHALAGRQVLRRDGRARHVGQGGGQQARLQGLGHVGALAVLQRAVGGERDALRQRLDQAPLVAHGPAPGVAPAEREDADRAPAGHERDERRAAAEHGVGGKLVGVLEEDRPVGLQGPCDERVALEREQPRAALGPARVGAGAAQLPGAVDDVQRAGVGDAGDDQLGHLLERLVAAQGALEQRAGVGQQPHAGVRGLAGAAGGLLDLQHALQLALLSHAIGDVARDDRHARVDRTPDAPSRGLDRHARPSGRWTSVRNGSAGSRPSRTPASRPATGRWTSSGRIERIEGSA